MFECFQLCLRQSSHIPIQQAAIQHYSTLIYVVLNPRPKGRGWGTPITVPWPYHGRGLRIWADDSGESQREEYPILEKGSEFSQSGHKERKESRHFFDPLLLQPYTVSGGFEGESIGQNGANPLSLYNQVTQSEFKHIHT